MATSTINPENEANGLYKRTGPGQYTLATDAEIVSVAAAINASKRRHRKGGVPSKYSPNLAEELYLLNRDSTNRMTIREIAESRGMSRSTVNRLIARHVKLLKTMKTIAGPFQHPPQQS